MIAVILFFVVIIATAILFGMWGTSLDKKEKQYKQDLLNLSKKWGELRTQKAHLDAMREAQHKCDERQEKEREKLVEWREMQNAREMTLRAKEEALDGKEKELNGKDAELQKFAAELDAVQASLAKREQELKDDNADVKTKEAILHFMGVTDEVAAQVKQPKKEQEEGDAITANHRILKQAKKTKK